jgi:hypothetical protein
MSEPRLSVREEFVLWGLLPLILACGETELNPAGVTAYPAL